MAAKQKAGITKSNGALKGVSTTKRGKAAKEPAPKRSYLKQSDVPAASLDEALRVPEALLDHYAGGPTVPLHLAKALNVDPGGSQFKLLTGASIAFGLTEGGAQATSVQVTDLARQILRPTGEGQAERAKRDAVLAPRVFSEFLRRYDGHSFPRQDLAVNVLEELGVPRGKAAEVLERIEASARDVGFLLEIKNKVHVSLGAHPATGTGQINPNTPVVAEDSSEDASPVARSTDEPINYSSATAPLVPTSPGRSSLASAIADDERRKKVFITHGKNREFVEPIKKLLEYGELTPVVSVERQSVSKPVPEKVMDDMRACGAAIIHVDAEPTGGDDHSERRNINPNVLIEIGAAMAFYGRRFILLVRDGVALPSNLQGLYEVRYTNDTLDATATIKLLDAIKDIKNYALPTDVKED